MSILQHPDQWTALDPKSMYSLLAGFPDQVRKNQDAGRSQSAVNDIADIRTIIVTGLGGSAIGGDLARAIAGPELKIPLLVNRDYELPRFADAHSLVFA